MQKSHIAHKILQYLVKHPDAQDTLDGIVQWWISEQKIRTQIGSVKKAIEELVAEDLIFERQRIGSKTHYRINPGKKKKIECLLKSGLPFDY